MRERLAIARSRSNYLLCGAEAWADSLGVLILRGLDNGDGDALRRAKWVIGRYLAGRYRLPFTKALAATQQVLQYLHDSRCKACEGRQFVRQETSVRACLACNGAGVCGVAPAAWGKPHLSALTAARGAIGRALKTARTEMDD